MKTVKEPIPSKEPVKRRKKLVAPEGPAPIEMQKEPALDRCPFFCLQSFPRNLSRRWRILAWRLSRGTGNCSLHHGAQFLLDEKVDEYGF